jgi:hypothetical protein
MRCVIEDCAEFVINGLIERNDFHGTKKSLMLSVRSCYNELVAGVIYDYVDHICYLTIYSICPSWATPRVIYEILKTPFKKNKEIKILRAVTSSENYKVKKFLIRLGFNHDGKLRMDRQDGRDVDVYSLTLKELEESKWAE